MMRTLGVAGASESGVIVKGRPAKYFLTRVKILLAILPISPSHCYLDSKGGHSFCCCILGLIPAHLAPRYSNQRNPPPSARRQVFRVGEGEAREGWQREFLPWLKNIWRSAFKTEGGGTEPVHTIAIRTAALSVSITRLVTVSRELPFLSSVCVQDSLIG